MVTTITIPFRFRGPPTSGNGGVSAGLLATRLGASVTVRLRRPPPLDTPLTVDIRQPVAVGEPVIVTGWKAGETEKRVDGGTAVVRADGSVLAIGHTRHARLPIDFAA